jgi:hypothetical protein
MQRPKEERAAAAARLGRIAHQWVVPAQSEGSIVDQRRALDFSGASSMYVVPARQARLMRRMAGVTA